MKAAFGPLFFKNFQSKASPHPPLRGTFSRKREKEQHKQQQLQLQLQQQQHFIALLK